MPLIFTRLAEPPATKQQQNIKDHLVVWNNMCNQSPMSNAQVNSASSKKNIKVYKRCFYVSLAYGNPKPCWCFSCPGMFFMCYDLILSYYYYLYGTVHALAMCIRVFFVFSAFLLVPGDDSYGLRNDWHSI